MTDVQLNIFSARSIFPEKKVHVQTNGMVWIRDYYPEQVTPRMAPWKPLADGHQALMLVERLGLSVRETRLGLWHAETRDGSAFEASASDDLRRAIVKCAAEVYRAGRVIAS